MGNADSNSGGGDSSGPRDFGSAFAAAHREQGSGGSFKWNGSDYSTNRADGRDLRAERSAGGQGTMGNSGGGGSIGSRDFGSAFAAAHRDQGSGGSFKFFDGCDYPTSRADGRDLRAERSVGVQTTGASTSNKTGISPEWVERVKTFEGFKEFPYKDLAGVWTNGYGNTQNVNEKTPKTNKTDATIKLEENLSVACKAVNQLVKVPLTQNQKDALISFTFNLGQGNLESSTLLKELNQGNYDAVPLELVKWDKATDPKTKTKVRVKGLTDRRKAEVELFRKK